MLKYKIGDRFEENQTDIEYAKAKFTISDHNCFGYLLTYDDIANSDHTLPDTEIYDAWIDAYFNKIEDSEIGEGDFSTILSSINDMLNEKDKRYGNSALKPLEIFAKHHGYGARLDEKLARVKNSDELRKNDVADIIGGLVLICRDNGWNDFSDQID